MRLLILTQKVDINDNNLGFFHRWIEEFAKQCESIIVVCLQKGEYRLPSNVKVISLGKEKYASRIKYLWNFYKYIFKYKNDYDGVFVHMNKEYVLLGGLLWKLWHKKIALWYTHKAVSWQLKLAEKLVDKIFTASKESFRLLSHKVEITGHGIDVESFASALDSPHDNRRIKFLSVGRIAPTKDYETIIRGLKEVNIEKIKQYDIVGEPIKPSDKEYKALLEKLNELLYATVDNDGTQKVLLTFYGVKHTDMPGVYRSHDILVHASRTGSIDKVVLEALASGRIVVTSSEAFADLAKEGLVYTFPQGDYQELAKTIEKIYNSGIIFPNEKAVEFVKKNHNLENVVVKISDFFKRP